MAKGFGGMENQRRQRGSFSVIRLHKRKEVVHMDLRSVMVGFQGRGPFLRSCTNVFHDLHVRWTGWPKL